MGVVIAQKAQAFSPLLLEAFSKIIETPLGHL